MPLHNVTLHSAQAWRWMGVASLCTVADQASKGVISAVFNLGAMRPVTGFFNLVRVMNPGAAFSFLADQTGWQRWFFMTLAMTASLALIVMLARKPHAKEALGYAMILGGAASNLLDRLQYGAVVDWLDFHLWNLHWPAFNLADVWIVCGAGWVIFVSVRRPTDSASQRDTHDH